MMPYPRYGNVQTANKGYIMAWKAELESKRGAYIDRRDKARKRGDWGSVRLFNETLRELTSMIKHLEAKEDKDATD